MDNQEHLHLGMLLLLNVEPISGILQQGISSLQLKADLRSSQIPKNDLTQKSPHSTHGFR